MTKIICRITSTVTLKLYLCRDFWICVEKYKDKKFK